MKELGRGSGLKDCAVIVQTPGTVTRRAVTRRPRFQDIRKIGARRKTRNARLIRQPGLRRRQTEPGFTLYQDGKRSDGRWIGNTEKMVGADVAGAFAA